MKTNQKRKDDDRDAAEVLLTPSTLNGAAGAGEDAETQARVPSVTLVIPPLAENFANGAAESGAPDENMQDIAFTIVDDPQNNSVYKGAGSYAATRAETAIRSVEETFPPLRFDLRFEKNLTALHVRARIHSSIDNGSFLTTLSNALTSTGTRLAPVVDELPNRSF